MQTENQTQNLELTAIKAYAATTKTPFRVAFMATLGVAAAQLLITFVFFGTLAAIGGTLVYILSR